MAKTLYIGNLPWKLSEDDIRAAFEAHAPVSSIRIISERDTGRSKGFGFVEVEDADADKVVKAMNGFELGGRALIVNEARPKADRA
ncbi:MAG: RNA-binding protein [Candidatus Saganbacteria bacterium]|nr:RNA-binding protein [Candidatus Saganbacteria bacterium]